MKKTTFIERIGGVYLNRMSVCAYNTTDKDIVMLIAEYPSGKTIFNDDGKVAIKTISREHFETIFEDQKELSTLVEALNACNIYLREQDEC